jgi:hypothetical protein
VRMQDGQPQPMLKLAAWSKFRTLPASSAVL